MPKLAETDRAWLSATWLWGTAVFPKQAQVVRRANAPGNTYINGAERARTANPRVANAVLSQLSYGPEYRGEVI